jgi:hypothetical protein
MAVVRITEQLVNDVMHKVGQQFDAAHAKAEALRPDIGDDVYDIIIGRPHGSDMTKCPKEFFNSYNMMYIYCNGFSPRSVSGDWGLSDERPFPHAIPDRRDVIYEDSHYRGVRITINRELEFAAIYEKLDKWQDALKIVADERQAAKMETKRVLESFTTLAPVLKAWPALWELLPDHVKDKHKQIVERPKPAKKVVVNTDTDALTGITARLTAARISAKKDI